MELVGLSAVRVEKSEVYAASILAVKASNSDVGEPGGDSATGEPEVDMVR
jgi:hypothetical protein